MEESSEVDDVDVTEPWWKNFELGDAALAEEVRDDFPILAAAFEEDGSIAFHSVDDNEIDDGEKKQKKRLVYLDSAATSQKPRAVVDAVSSYYSTANSNVHRGAHALSRRATELYESARDKTAAFVNAASRNEIVFTSGASEAINLVAYGYSCTCGRAPKVDGQPYLAEGDEIIISEMEHHSNIVPWQMAAERSGAVLRYVPLNPATAFGENDSSGSSSSFDLEAFRNLVNPSTKIVSLQHVSNVLGAVHPIAQIVDIVRSQAHPDCAILLDACQSVPHSVVDVQSLGVDFLAASGHKMCAPTGIGFLWGKEDLLNSLPPYRGGGEMIDDVTMERSTYAQSPGRFEAGTPPIAQAVGLGAAIDYLTHIGMDRIHDYEVELGNYLRRRMDDVAGVRVMGPAVGIDRAALCAFVCDNVHPSDLSTFLDTEGVAVRAGHHCCQPLHRALGVSHSARASLYFYNTKEDVDAFVGHLEDTLKFFGSLSSGNGGANANGDGEAGDDGDDDAFVPLF